jgi:hypothetical protein
VPNGDGNNLGVQRDINKILMERDKILKRQTQQISGQVRLAMELCKALDCKELEGMEKRVKGVEEGLKGAADEASRMGNQTRRLSRDTRSQDKEQKKLNKTLTNSKVAAGGFFVGMVSGLKVSIAQTKALIDTVLRVGDAFFKVGSSIAAIPFKMLGGLIEMSNMFSGAAPVMKQAWEEVRKTFGNLAGPTGKALEKSFKSMRQSSKNLAGSGLSMRRIFGPGREGRAAGLKYMNEQMIAMGPLLDNFRKEFRDSKGELIVFQKGLGLSNEHLKAMGGYALSTGKSLRQTLTETTKMSKGFATRFGMDAKTIALDMATMTQDFAHFGTLSQQEMAESAVFVRKLGLEIKDLGGIIDKFLNFDDATQSVAKLNQAFGTQIDSMKMLRMADKGQIGPMVDHIKKELASAGVSFEKLGGAQRKLLSESTNLSVEQLGLMMSSKNAARSMDEMRKAGGDVAKSQMSEKQATKALGKDIEKVYATGSKTFKGFGDALAQGFNRGILRGKGFRKMLRNVRRTMMQFYWAGVKFGKLFIDEFPGMQNVVQGLRKLFDPKKWKNLLSGVLDEFKIFFRGGASNLEGLVEGIKRRLKDFFGLQGDAVRQIKEGFKTIGLVIVKLIGQAIPMALKAFAKMVRAIADYIRNPPEMRAAAYPFVHEFWMAVKEAFVATWEAIAEDLWPALKDLWSAIWEKHSEKIIKIGMVWVAFVTTKMLIAGVASAVKGAAMFGVVQLFTGFFTKAMAAVSASPTGGQMAAGMCGMGKGLGAGLSSFAKSTAGISVGTIAMMAIKLALISAALIPAMKILSYGLKQMIYTFSDVSLKDMAKLFLLLMGIGPPFLMFAVSLKLMPDDLMGIGAKLMAMAGLAAIMAIFMVALIPVARLAGTLTLEEIGKLFLLTVTGVIGMLGVSAAFKMASGSVDPAFVAVLPALLSMFTTLLLTLAVFLAALVVVAAIASAVSLPSVGKLFIITVTGVIGMLGTAFVLKEIGSMDLDSLAFGLAGMAVMMFQLGIFLLALTAIAATTSSLSAPTVAKFAIVAITGVAALWGVATVLAQVGGMDFLSLVFALVAMTPMMDATAGFGESLSNSIKRVGDMPSMESILKYFLALYMGIGALIGVGAVAIALGAIVGTGVGGVLLVLGIIAAGALLEAIDDELIPHLKSMTKSMNDAGGGKNAKDTVDAVFGVLSGLGSNIGTFMKLGIMQAFSFLPGGMSTLKSGITSAGELAKLMMDSLLPALGAVMTSIAQHGVDVKKTKETITALTGIVAATAPLATLAQQILKMDDITPKEAEKVAGAMAKMFKGLMGSMREMVDSILGSIQKLPKEDIKKATAIGGVLDGLSKLVSSILASEIFAAATRRKVSSGGSILLGLGRSGTTSYDVGVGVEKALGFIQTTLQIVIPAMVGFIRSLMLLAGTVMNDPAMRGTSPVQIEQMMNVMGNAAKIIASMASAYTDMMEPFAKLMGTQWRKTSDDATSQKQQDRSFFFVKRLSGFVKNLMGVDLGTIIKSIVKIANSSDMQGVSPKKIKKVSEVMKIIGSFAAALSTISNLLPQTAQNKLGNPSKLSEEINRVKRIFVFVDGIMKILLGKYATGGVGLKDFVGAIADIARDDRVSKVRKSDLQKIKIAMDTVASLANAMSSASQALKSIGGVGGGIQPMSAEEKQSASKNMSGLTDLAGVLKDVLVGGRPPLAGGGMIEIINELGAAAKGITASKKQITRLKDIVELIRSLSVTMTHLQQTAGSFEGGAGFGGISTLLDSLTAFLVGEDESAGTSLSKFVKVVNTQVKAAVANVTTTITTLKKVDNVISAVSNTIRNLGQKGMGGVVRKTHRSGGGARGEERLSFLTVRFYDVLSFYFGRPVGRAAHGEGKKLGGFFGFIDTFGKAIENPIVKAALSRFASVKKVFGQLESLQGSITQVSNLAFHVGTLFAKTGGAIVMKSFSANAFNLAHGLGEFARGLATFPSGIATEVAQAVKDIAEMNAEILAFAQGGFTVGATLKEFGQAVALDDLTVKVERGETPIQWNVTFNVAIEADDLALALSQDANKGRTSKNSALMLANRAGP